MKTKVIKLFYILVIIITINEFAFGQDLFAIPVKDLNGTITTLAKVSDDDLLILDFWATWCKPCAKSIPKFKELSDKYKEKGLSFIGVNEDSPRNISKVKPFVNSMNINYQVLLDSDQELMSELLVSAFPTLILIYREAKVLFLH